MSGWLTINKQNEQKGSEEKHVFVLMLVMVMVLLVLLVMLVMVVVVMHLDIGVLPDNGSR